MIRFGPFEFDALQRRLLREGSDVHLTPKAFDLLAALIEAAPRVLHPRVEVKRTHEVVHRGRVLRACGKKDGWVPQDLA